MKFIKGRFDGEEHLIAYSDYGTGSPVVLIHGWPLSREMWEFQLQALVNAGHRVIKYDRRGFGASSKPWDGYNYDSFTDDLKLLLEELDLQDVTLVGFAMGGGEVVRYLNRYGRARIRRIALIASVTPFMLKTSDNPEGIDGSVFEDMAEQIQEDRINFLDGFGKKFFGVNLLSHPVSVPLLEYYRMLGSQASPNATLKCLTTFSQTDFREDLKRVEVPTLIIHGDSDKIIPIEISGDRTAKMIPHASYIVYEGAPHGLFYTHRDKLNQDLIDFMTGIIPFGKKQIQEDLRYV